MTLIYPKRSSAELKEMASALNVEVTTRGIRRELQAMGHTTVRSFLARSKSVEKISEPCLYARSFDPENEASEKEQKVTWCSGIGTIIRQTGYFFPSYKTLLASKRCCA